MTGSGFTAIVRFEIVRTVRKPQFWIAAVLMPALFAIIAFAVAWSSAASPESSDSSTITFEYVAPTGLISEDAAAVLHGTPTDGRAAAVDRVKDGSLQALFVFTGSSPQYEVDIYAQDKGVLLNGTYQELARNVFDRSVDTKVDSPQLVQEFRSGVATHVFAFSDGHAASGLGAQIPPALLVLVLVLAIAFLGNQMLNATVEEKENRISEMLLVSISARTLIHAKIAALTVIGLIQICVVAVPSLLLLSVFGLGDTLYGLQVGPLQFDLVPMVSGILILIGGLFLVTSALVTIGAMMPSAKEAAPFYSVVVLATIAPLYLVTSIIVDPQSAVATVMTFIPPFAAATALLRNAVGGLDPLASVLVIFELFGLSGVLLRFAISVFQRGVIQYGKRVPVLTALKLHARSGA